jgi:hypothetical protein
MGKRPILCAPAVFLLGICGVTAHADVFSLVALPDTQFYSRYSDLANYSNFENPFETQTQWLADNAASRNIAFTMHLGDVVDQSDVIAEWQYADAAMAILDNNSIDYGVCRGNHDLYGNTFVTWFGPSRFAGMPTYQGSDATGINSYHIFSAGGYSFLVLFTDWRMDAAEVAWAQDVLDAHWEKPTILISHQILSVDGNSPAAPVHTDNGNFLWDELIADNDQIFMTINGHHHGTAWLVRPNTFGRDVLQMVVDYQSAFANGAGYWREMVFDTDANTLAGRTWSPWLQKGRDLGLLIAPGWVTTEVTTPDAHFDLALDFAQRFAPVCVGDENGDGSTNIADLALIQPHFGEVGAGLPGDVDDDGDVDGRDIDLILSKFGRGC